MRFGWPERRLDRPVRRVVGRRRAVSRVHRIPAKDWRSGCILQHLLGRYRLLQTNFPLTLFPLFGAPFLAALFQFVASRLNILIGRFDIVNIVSLIVISRAGAFQFKRLDGLFRQFRPPLAVVGHAVFIHPVVDLERGHRQRRQQPPPKCCNKCRSLSRYPAVATAPGAP